mmetsp:Transcript_26585/g.32209  ORF Transcript_26585/g.32209 Transcript_26585/m.32209 type:complete len:228 (-) Transcript_26585:343-1026(-)
MSLPLPNVKADYKNNNTNLISNSHVSNNHDTVYTTNNARPATLNNDTPIYAGALEMTSDNAPLMISKINIAQNHNDSPMYAPHKITKDDNMMSHKLTSHPDATNYNANILIHWHDAILDPPSTSSTSIQADFSLADFDALLCDKNSLQYDISVAQSSIPSNSYIVSTMTNKISQLKSTLQKTQTARQFPSPQTKINSSYSPPNPTSNSTSRHHIYTQRHPQKLHFQH